MAAPAHRTIHIPNVDPSVIDTLQKRAYAAGISLENYLRDLLTTTASHPDFPQRPSVQEKITELTHRAPIAINGDFDVVGAIRTVRDA
ncbi:FitA-like ribbon-helix-helix domain-containing protein [Corynebacterium sp. YSMAA1_1_D6]|uniref:FitA-like ribbon-helix-helix domain-containing protein n=1 Tax=Corynebacterium sp. YSMAA1_1_D6 TaxID=3383589 RepID=UPI0038CF8520